jgi:hypothetical protein
MSDIPAYRLHYTQDRAYPSLKDTQAIWKLSMINMALEGVRLLEEKEGSVYPYMNDVMEGINTTIREVRDYLVDRLAEEEESQVATGASEATEEEQTVNE